MAPSETAGTEEDVDRTGGGMTMVVGGEGGIIVGIVRIGSHDENLRRISDTFCKLLGPPPKNYVHKRIFLKV